MEKEIIVSIIVLSYNRPQQTKKCIESIYLKTKTSFELIVIDNGSDYENYKPIKDLAKQLKYIRVIRLPNNIGVASGRNYGANLAKGKYIVFLDDDITVITDGWINQLIERLKSIHGASVVGCRVMQKDTVLMSGGWFKFQKGKIILDSSYGNLNKNDPRIRLSECDMIHGGATLYRKKLFEKFEFPEFYFYGCEDCDFMMQIKQFGHKLINSDVEVEHIKTPLDARSNDIEYRKNIKAQLEKSRILLEERWNITYKKDWPLFSILMAVNTDDYGNDGDKFLIDALDSILMQSEQDFELILINDGSTESSIKIMEKYRDDNKDKIKLFSKPKSGLTDSLNYGLRFCSAEIIVRQDADDISHPNRIARQYSILKSNDSLGAVGCFYIHIDKDKNLVAKHCVKPQEQSIDKLAGSIPGGGAMLRKNVIEKLGGWKQKYAQDADMWIRMIRAGYKLINAEEVLYSYRVHPGQISSKHRDDQISCVKSSLNGKIPEDKKTYKLHIGCGRDYMDGYVNIDCATHKEYIPGGVLKDPCLFMEKEEYQSKVKSFEFKVDRISKIQDLDYPEESISEIVCNHTLEHLPFREAIEALRNFYKFLIKGGKLILEVPDAGQLFSQFSNANLMRKKKLYELLFCNQCTPAEYHLSAWDRETIKSILEEIGFKAYQIISGHDYDKPVITIETIK